jgi:hypothetical protein
MYAMTSYPFVKRTLATFRIAEFGFFGVLVMTWMHTPRRNGEFSKAGDLDLLRILFRPLRTSWLIVGIAAAFLLIRCSQPLEKRSADNTVRILRCN